MAISETAYQYFISKYKPEFCEMLLEHCAEGRSIETFAAKINTVPEALMFWSNKYVDFEVCLRVAYWKSYAYWEDLVIEDTKQIREFKVLEPTIFKMVMKNRYKWRDTTDDIMMMIGSLSDAELEDRAKKILEARSGQVITARMVENES